MTQIDADEGTGRSELLGVLDSVFAGELWRTVVVNLLWPGLRVFICVNLRHLRHLRTVAFFYRTSLAR